MKTPKSVQVTNRVLYWRQHLQFIQVKRITSNSLTKARPLGNIEVSPSTPQQKARKQPSLVNKELQVAKHNNKTDQIQQELDIMQQEAIWMLHISSHAKEIMCQRI